MPPARGFVAKQRTPLVIAACVGAGSVFIGLKWRAVMQRSEEAKRAAGKNINYTVAPGRSGGGI
ncbi:hypothetical protein M430DRAFT_37048 [Amorphotheca resinae ATCC 22711]|uniref:Uncharacterized protein n=1 Tax=Amorphotheca resinae ATCC 22711 TaxID=857342 RepID=A0A2T3ATS6_AMORE|nr:hypothetical protein M430DRAFT_37048 [Amorphotheca resinae ATCC 22711]PSS10887.1 hypothetical protein M430DRAFT_37048 [Amorphotheca resinae ATCC 22711]